ncbi:MAG: MBL fold metallo-hydrolase, partial [Leptospiraceae bacterium]|nr:MBL fold metallo-hydrolase [Leptospiraceae bacterium]
LGTGTSHGVPLIACTCKTCSSDNPKNTRYRTSVFLEVENTHILIDTPPEFRLRALEYGIEKIDTVLFTHAHSDHCSGLDDIRRFNEIQKASIPIYGNSESLIDLRKRFQYIFEQTQEGGGKPKITLSLIQNEQEFYLGSLAILPLTVLHGTIPVTAFRIQNFAYMTDVSEIPDSVFPLLKGLEILVLDALRTEPHPTHFNLSQAIEAAMKIGAKKTYFTHISHRLEHEETEKNLPDGMFMAYDGLELEI